MSAEVLLDVRELAPPGPFECLLKAISFLKAGEYIKMIHRRFPCKAPDLASKHCLEIKVLLENDDHVEIILFNPSDVAVMQELKKLGYV